MSIHSYGLQPHTPAVPSLQRWRICPADRWSPESSCSATGGAGQEGGQGLPVLQVREAIMVQGPRSLYLTIFFIFIFFLYALYLELLYKHRCNSIIHWVMVIFLKAPAQPKLLELGQKLQKTYHARAFLLNRPRGWFSLEVVMSVCVLAC